MDAFWQAINKYMTYNDTKLAPPPKSCLNVAVTKNDVPFPLALQHDLGPPEKDPETIATKAKSIQPLPIIPLTMTDEELFPHFSQDLAALQPPGVVIDDETIRRLFDWLITKREERLKKLTKIKSTKNN